MSFTTSTNPDYRSKDEIHALVKYCPICGALWPYLQKECSNKDCGTKLRVEPKALNWWMFYPKVNGWGNL